MSTESSSPFSWHFNLGRIPVVVEPGFWLMAVLFGLLMRMDDWRGMLSWVIVVFVSVLLHELGHSTVAMSLGCDVTSIRLYYFGGLAYRDRKLSRWRDVAISAAGPFAGFLFGGVMLAVNYFVPPQTYLTRLIFYQIMWVNFGWGIFNLMPVQPLDGGNILKGVLGPTRQRISLWVSIVVGSLITLYFISQRAFFGVFMFGRMVYDNWQDLSVTRDVRPLAPIKAAAPEPEALARGWAALRSGQETEAARLAHLAFSAAAPGAECNAVRDLLAWVALAEGNPRAALSHLEKVVPPEDARAFSWAMAYEAAGLPDRALAPALVALDKEPSEAGVGLAVRLLVKARRLEEAERAARDFAWKSLARRDALLADIAVARGDFGAAATLFATTFESTGRADQAYQAALNHARGAQLERATEWLKRALDAGYDDLEAVGQEPLLAPVRLAPEIAERLRKSVS